MTGYIDMHCHILPGVDDGAHDISEMKAMLKIAYNDGIRCILATPHFHPVYGRTSPDILKKKLFLPAKSSPLHRSSFPYISWQ